MVVPECGQGVAECSVGVGMAARVHLSCVCTEIGTETATEKDDRKGREGGEGGEGMDSGKREREGEGKRGKGVCLSACIVHTNIVT